MRLLSRSHLRAAVALLPVVAVAVACAPPRTGPSAPYDHPPLRETSVASAVTVGGEVGALAGGLADAGYSCAQVRANEAAVQVQCRRAPGPVDVHLVAAPPGELVFGQLGLVMSDAPSDALQEALETSVLRVWPGHRDDLEQLVEDTRPPEPFMSFGAEAGPSYEERYYQEGEAAGSLHYSLDVSWGEPLTLTIRGTGLRDRSWPYGADHCARTVSDSLAPLAALGFRCSANGCWRPSDDQYLRFRTSGDQITEVTFDLPEDPAAARWAAEDLPFLTPQVEPAVRAQLARSLEAGHSFAGVVAGTALVVDTPRSHSRAGAPVPGFTVTIGVPLIVPG